MEYKILSIAESRFQTLLAEGWRIVGSAVRNTTEGSTYTDQILAPPARFEHMLVDGEKRDVARKLRELGDEGWEAFPVHDASNKPGELTFFLKREKRAKSKEIPSSAGTDAPTIS